MRKFKLINANGEEFDLMRKDAFFHAPEGLGSAKAYEYMRAGTAFEATDFFEDQKSVGGEIVFANYSVYDEFIRFIAFTPLKFAYMPLNEWAYLDGELVTLEKTEISEKLDVLVCPIEFLGTSLWYIPREATQTDPSVEDAKLYDYTYNYTYADTLNGVLLINNLSAEESPLKITIFGQIENPTWTLTVNDKQVGSGAVTATIGNGNKLVINSKDGELEVTEYTAANVFVRNLYQMTDFSRQTFLYAPSGTSQLTITGIIEGAINAWVEVEELHETV